MASGIDGQADAGAVADTVAAFYAGTMVEELVTIPGIVDVNALTGLVITINCPAHAAYAAREVFVLGGGVEHAVGITQLNVLRRL